MQIDILKCHGSGNDFVLVDELKAPLPMNADERIAWVKWVTDRNQEIGGDGVLFVQASQIADCRMKMYNPDGSEASMCGNGLRCVGRYVLDRVHQTRVRVETMKAVLAVEKTADLLPGLATFTAEIGPISMQPQSLPMNVAGERFVEQEIDFLGGRFTAVSVPNPHIITLVDEIHPETVKTCGEKANACTLFPQGVNVSFVRVWGEGEIFVMTYERGVGLTHSCGTAMSASAYVTSMLNQWSPARTITVYNKGGMVRCTKNGEHGMILAGNATYMYRASLSMDSFTRVGQIFARVSYPEEAEIYDRLVKEALVSLGKFR